MTSKCTRSAPARTTACTSSPRRAKSADRMLGAMRYVMGSPADDCTCSLRPTRVRPVAALARPRPPHDTEKQEQCDARFEQQPEKVHRSREGILAAIMRARHLKTQTSRCTCALTLVL